MGPSQRRLSSERVVSSIPREFVNGATPPPVQSTAHSSSTHIDPSTESNWVYPSELQFFQAMLRKNHNPNAADMATIVPIHNAVNERAWAELLKWERGQGGEKCGGVKLISFKGRPKDRTPKAWINTALG
jgi:cytochrome c heme-lyase